MRETGAVAQKQTARRSGYNGSAGGKAKKLNLLFLGRRRGCLGRLRLGQTLLELVHASGRVHELLLASVKRMAHVADTNDHSLLGGTGFDHVAAGATDFRVAIFRMNISFHKKGRSE